MGKILYSKEHIDNIVTDISKDLIRLIDDNNMQTPTLLCILDGAFRFYADLVEQISIPVLCDFIKVSSYNKKEQVDIKIHKFPKYPISGHDIILIDDIYDTGNTINYILDQLLHYHPKSLSVITLLHRKGAPEMPGYLLKYISGFEIDDEWVAGYGLDDFEGTSRNLNYIYELEKK